MVLLIRKKHLLAAVTGAALLLGAAAVSPRPSAATVSATASTGQVVILDAGHGGADGGAVSDSGVPESGVNLAITQRLGGVLSFCGHTVALTREGEDALCDGTGTLRQQKVSDTKKRVELVNSFPHGFLISIHQNSLPGHPTVRGAQSFHNGKGTAETAALSIQQALNDAVNERDKAAKRMDDSIYLMKHADCSAVLVECGFLSNPEETVLLQQPDYQLHIAAAIAAGFCQYCTNEG
ncbi:MAG TPA: N-acetylmuramoyl-L-alanine amidase [Oscillibacter sp.]|nr:N-acetylmuramoyl-L-alanine amidase [Oscillibacter sp.]